MIFAMNQFSVALQIHKNSFSNYHKSLSGSANGELMCSAQKLLWVNSALPGALKCVEVKLAHGVLML